MVFETTDYGDTMDTLDIGRKFFDLTHPMNSTGCKYHFVNDNKKFTLPAAIRVPWPPDDEVKKPKSSWDKNAWMQGLIDETVISELPLIEGPRRVKNAT